MNLLDRIYLIAVRAIAHEGGLSGLIRKLGNVLANEGVRGVAYRINFLKRRTYRTVKHPEYLYREPEFTERVTAEIEGFRNRPKFVVFLRDYQTTEQLEATVSSLIGQWYVNWEAWLSPDCESLLTNSTCRNDARLLRSAGRESNGRDYVLSLNGGGVLTPDALFRFASCLMEQDWDVVYSDEDNLHDGTCVSPSFKPDHSPELLQSRCYPGQLTCVRMNWTPNGSLSWELLKDIQQRNGTFGHIDRVLFHSVGTSQLINDYPTAAIEAGLAPGTVRARYPISESTSIRIVCGEVPSAALESKIRRAAGQLNPQVSGPEHELTGDWVEDYVVFLDARIVDLRAGTLEALLEHAARPGIGVVGGRIVDRAKRVHEAGYVVTPDSHLGLHSPFRGLHRDREGYGQRNLCVGNYQIPGTMLVMMSSDTFRAAGAMNVDSTGGGYKIVDLCLRVQGLGLRNVFTPFAEGIIPVQREPEMSEVARERESLYKLKMKHEEIFAKPDPYYNRNLSQDPGGFLPALINTSDFDQAVRQPFEPQVLSVTENAPLRRRSICVFAHYDPDGLVAPYVLYYLSVLATEVDIVFVSTAALASSEIAKLSAVANRVIVRGNAGYDFGSWHTGLSSLSNQWGELDRVLLCNDSCFGPVHSLDEFWRQWSTSGADVYSVTDSCEIYPHLQSYFIAFNRTVLQSDAFRLFWANLTMVKNKELIVLDSEVGLSRQLGQAGFVLSCMAPFTKVGYFNNTHVQWLKLLQEYHAPFIKIDLLRSNPTGADLTDFDSVLRVNTDFDPELIYQHLRRMEDCAVSLNPTRLNKKQSA